jgi:hypothetical protein
MKGFIVATLLFISSLLSAQQGPMGPRGYTGARGPAGTATVGTVTTLNPGVPAYVNNVGTESQGVLNFGIPRGSVIFTGTGAPSNTLGGNGDFYLDTAAGCFYGPKASGLWPTSCTILLGPTGPAGPAGTAAITTGSGTPSLTCNSTTNNGLLYANTSNNHLYYCNGATSSWVDMSVSVTPASINAAFAISPLSYGAVCNAQWNNSTNTFTGTDDRQAFISMFNDMANNSFARTVQLPEGKMCRIDPPGGIITAFAIVSSTHTVTITMNNSLVAGEIVTPQGLSVGTYLNGAPLQVITASSTQFTAQFYHADVSTTSDSGYGVTPAIEFGDRYHNGFRIIGHNGSSGQNGSGWTSGATPNYADLAGGAHSTTASVGPFFQLGYDRTANVTTWSLDGSGNLTLNYQAMPSTTAFVVGQSVIVSNTGTVDATYHTIATATSTQITITGVSGSAASGSGGILHQPWSAADFAGASYNLQMDNITLKSYNRTNQVTCAQNWFYCNYVPYTYGVYDNRGGGIIMNNVSMSGLHYGLFAIQSDFDYINNFNFNDGYMGLYFGPWSTPSYVDRYSDYGDDVSIEVDGILSQGITISNSHFRSGSASTAQVMLVNRLYDSTANYGGGIPSTGIALINDDFEFGGGCPGTSTPTSFISVDTDSAGATSSNDIFIDNSTFVNYASGSCNVPDFVRVGKKSGGPAAVSVYKLDLAASALTNIVNYVGTSGSAKIAVLSPDLGMYAITPAVATGGGTGSVNAFTMQNRAPVNAPSFTGQVTLDGTGGYTSLMLPYAGVNNYIPIQLNCSGLTVNCIYFETGGSSPYGLSMYSASGPYGTVYAAFGPRGLNVNNANGGFYYTTGTSADPGSYSAGQEWFNTTSLRKKFYDGTNLNAYAWLSDINCSTAPTGTPSSSTYLAGNCTWKNPLSSPTISGSLTLDSNAGYPALIIPYLGTASVSPVNFGCSGNTYQCLYLYTAGATPRMILGAGYGFGGSTGATFGATGVSANNANGGYFYETGQSSDPGSTSAGQQWFNTTNAHKGFYTGSATKYFAWLQDFNCSAAPTGTQDSQHALGANCVNNAYMRAVDTPAGTPTFTAGTNVTSVSCSGSGSCTNTRGELTIVGGTATTGTIATVNFSTTLPAAPGLCMVSQEGGTSHYGIAHGTPSTSSFTITSAVSVSGVTLTVDYVCVL